MNNEKSPASIMKVLLDQLQEKAKRLRERAEELVAVITEPPQ